MATLNIRLAVPSPTGVNLPRGGVMHFAPTKRRNVGTTVVLPRPFSVALSGDVTAVVLAETSADWAWQIVEPGGTHTRYLKIQGAGPLEYANLLDIDPSTLTPVAEPEAAWWVEILSQLYTGHVDGSGHLILVRRDGDTEDAGSFIGPQGPQGAQGIQGTQGLTGDMAAIVNALGFSGNFPMVALGATTPTHLNFTLTGDAVLDFTGFNGGSRSYSISAVITQDAASPTRVVTYPGVKSSDGFPPQLGLYAGANLALTFVWTDATMGWLGLVGGRNFA